MCGICLTISRDAEHCGECCDLLSSFKKLKEESYCLVSNRGPDAHDRQRQILHGKENDAGVIIDIRGCVLHLRGSLTSQPLKDIDGNILLWNGEIFGGNVQIQESENDGVKLLEELSGIDVNGSDDENEKHIVGIFQQIHGPWAFVYWQNEKKRIWFGRDYFGRRSLLWHLPKSPKNIFMLASVVCQSLCMDFTEVPAKQIYCIKQESMLEFWSGNSNGAGLDSCVKAFTICLPKPDFTSKSAPQLCGCITEKENSLITVSDHNAFEGDEVNFSNSTNTLCCKDRLGINGNVKLEFENSCNCLEAKECFESSNIKSLNGRIVQCSKNCAAKKENSHESNTIEALTENVLTLRATEDCSKEKPKNSSTSIVNEGATDNILTYGTKYSREEKMEHSNKSIAKKGETDNVLRLSSTKDSSDENTESSSKSIVNEDGTDNVMRLSSTTDGNEGKTYSVQTDLICKLCRLLQWQISMQHPPPQDHEINKRFLNHYTTAFMDYLEEATRRRVFNLPRSEDEDKLDSRKKVDIAALNEKLSLERKRVDEVAKVGILFSGGIDSMVISAMADRCIPKDEPIDLLNVAFEQKNRHPQLGKNRSKKDVESNKNPYDVPDRVTGKAGVLELNSERTWNFIEINVTLEEVRAARENRLRHLVYPLQTVLDDSIGCAIWFASGGKGTQYQVRNGELFKVADAYASTAKVLLTGMGADEQLGGYARHRSKFEKFGWEGLEEEIQMEIARISSRNLGRDDRCISDHGREARFPFLDENVVSFLQAVPVWIKCDPRLPRGHGEKRLLRELARTLNLHNSAALPKRAIQFGSKIAKLENNKEKGSDSCNRLNKTIDSL